jgi:ABC-2 type transport system permease protein
MLVSLEGLMITGLSIARERELGTFEQLLVSPLSPGEIVIGKTVPAYLVGMAEGTMMLLVAVFVFRVPLTGSIGLLYVGISVYLVAIIGVGLFISSIARTQQQAILGTFAFMVPMSLLSGFASPVENMPEWLQYLTLANPMRHFIVIAKGVFLKAMPPEELIHNIWPLIVIAVVTLIGSSELFRRET